MKNPLVNLLFALLPLALVSCGQKGHEHDMHDAAADMDKHKALYDEVMNIHNEAMPKLDEIYKVKESLKNKIASTPALAEDKKKEIDAAIAKLDSASEGMMDWMHKFSPLPDTADDEAATQYLKAEKVKVEKVKEDILTAIEKGKALN